MSLYFAPAFFSHLLGKCLRWKYPIVEVLKLAFVILGTFAIVWWPFLHSPEAALQVMVDYTLVYFMFKETTHHL
jgi:alpha-1,3-glucosyltransferase